VDLSSRDLLIYVFLFTFFAVLPPTTSTSKAAKLEDICRSTIDEGESSMSSLATNMSTSSSSSASSTQPSSRRLISVDFSLFKVN